MPFGLFCVSETDGFAPFSLFHRPFLRLNAVFFILNATSPTTVAFTLRIYEILKRKEKSGEILGKRFEYREGIRREGEQLERRKYFLVAERAAIQSVFGRNGLRLE